MADAKISSLLTAAALSGAEQIPLVQSGATKKTTLTVLSAFGNTGAKRTTRSCYTATVSGDNQLDESDVTWPAVATVDLLVPVYADRAIVRVTLGQIYAVTSACNANLKIVFGGLSPGRSRRIRWDGTTGAPHEGANSANDINLADEFTVSTLQGTTQTVRVEGDAAVGTENGRLRHTTEAVVSIDVEFIED